MFQHCQPLNLQTKSSQPRLEPSHHFLTGQSLSHHLNNWLRWQCLSWQPNLLNFVQSSFQPCKIEEPEPTYQHGSQSTENLHMYNPDLCISHLKSEQIKEEEQDINVLAQKKAIYLTRKEHLNQEEIDILKQYRSMRVQHYLNKKEKRTFEKKIVYATRKRVADKRIRYKGKFINEIQAKQLLGLSCSDLSFEELKVRMKQLKSQS